jgi:hypothetical protein
LVQVALEEQLMALMAVAVVVESLIVQPPL